MNQLVNIPVDLSRTAEALEAMALLLQRIVLCLERLSPEIPLPANAAYQAGLGDLRYTDPDTIGKVRSELETFAANNNVVVDSEAYLEAIKTYEREVAETFGVRAIEELPWNKAAGGSLFRENRVVQPSGGKPGEAGETGQGEADPKSKAAAK